MAAHVGKSVAAQPALAAAKRGPRRPEVSPDSAGLCCTAGLPRPGEGIWACCAVFTVYARFFVPADTLVSSIVAVPVPASVAERRTVELNTRSRRLECENQGDTGPTRLSSAAPNGKLDIGRVLSADLDSKISGRRIGKVVAICTRESQSEAVPWCKEPRGW